MSWFTLSFESSYALRSEYHAYRDEPDHPAPSSSLAKNGFSGDGVAESDSCSEAEASLVMIPSAVKAQHSWAKIFSRNLIINIGRTWLIRPGGSFPGVTGHRQADLVQDKGMPDPYPNRT